MGVLLQLVFAAAVAASVRATGREQDGSPLYQWDPQGYVLYCPCMGQFGNQAAQFLGSLEFAKQLNRTLAIPPWWSYKYKRSILFTEWFQLEPVQSYHKSIPLEVFMEQLAPERWPPGERAGYCYLPPNLETDADCQMKAGNPYGAFWDELGVEFDRSKATWLSFNISNEGILKQWVENYPPDKYPVLAFKLAPALFPTRKENRHLQKYVKWNDHMMQMAEEFINGTMGGQPYIAVHMRIASNHVRGCEHVEGRSSYMASPQCLEDIPGAVVTKDLCRPSKEYMAKHIRSLVEKTGITALFIASDRDPDVPDLEQRMGAKVQIYRPSSDFPQLDLMLLARANYFIGTCVSSFTAFAKRERDANGLPSEFWGEPKSRPKQNPGTSKKTEL